MPHWACEFLGQFDIQTMFDALLIVKSTFIVLMIKML